MGAIESRLAEIKERIVKAAQRSGRKPETVKLLPVSKAQSVEQIKQVKELGLTDFGESRVQELRDKREQVAGVDWHMVGHLQRNKVKYLARMENCRLIHSLDSLRLARKIEDRGEKADRKIKALVQVNVAKDENKFGFLPEEVETLLEQAADFEYLKIKGLMTLVPYVEDAEKVRPYFRQLREMFLDFKAADIAGVEMKELSMGMTNDFEVAIEEGATIVRIGRGIFGARGNQ